MLCIDRTFIPKVHFVRSAVIRHLKILQDARMAGLVKLRCGIVTDGGGLLRADLALLDVGQHPVAFAKYFGSKQRSRQAKPSALRPTLGFALNYAIGYTFEKGAYPKTPRH